MIWNNRKTLLIVFSLVVVTLSLNVPVSAVDYHASGGTFRELLSYPFSMRVTGVVVVISVRKRPHGSQSWSVVQVKTVVSDARGRYSATVPCHFDPDAQVSYSANALHIDGTLGVGGGLSAGSGLCDTGELGFGGDTRLQGQAAMPSDFQGAGATFSYQSVGCPINTATGNMWLEQSDYLLPGLDEPLAINRTYNSAIQDGGLFGPGWSSNYDIGLRGPNQDYSQLRLPGGRSFIFRRENNLYFPTTSNFYGSLVKNADGTFTVTFTDGNIYQFNGDGKLTSSKYRQGNQTNFGYVGNNLTSITDPFDRTLNLSYNSFGLVSEIADSQGVIATYSYANYCGSIPCRVLQSVVYGDGSKYDFDYQAINNQAYLKTVKDALGNILEKHEYDADGRATTSEKEGGVEKFTLDYSNWTAATPYTQVTDALGRVTKYYFAQFGSQRLVTKTEGVCSCGGSGSEVAQYFYDQSGNLTRKIDALGREVTYTYNSNGYRLSMTDVLGTESYTHNSYGQILTRTDRMGGVWTNTYDSVGKLLTTKDPLNHTTTLTYSPLGQIATIKDARNKTTTLTYDTQGRMTEIKNANNEITTFGYDSRVRVTSVTNAVDETTTFEYDLKDRLKKVIYPDKNFVTYVYDLAGRRTSVIDARNKTTVFGYDGAYRLTSVTDPLSHTISFVYDLMSNLTSQTDALGNTTDYNYDDFNRLKKTIYPVAASGVTRLEESLTYDQLGNVKTRVDTAGRTTSYDYDSANRLIKITDALTKLTQFEYNSRSQLIKVKDALNQEYSFTHDPLGRQLSQTRAGSTMSFQYDAVGNRIKRIDHAGRETEYEYDNLNRLKKIDYLSGTGNSVPGLQVTYNYDDLSRLQSAINEAGIVSFTYDNRGRLKTETDVFGHVVEYGYDANGNRILLKLDGSNYATYSYDDANRLTGLTNSSDNTTTTYSYDVADRLASRLLPNGLTTTYDYDGMSRLKQLKDASATTTLFDRQYSYNNASQIGQIIEPDRTRTFTYDDIDRLTNVTDPLNGNETYVYDAVSNRTSSHRSGKYSYQPFNRMTATATSSMTYDPNGNMVSKSEGSNFWRYTWDYENRLTEARTRKEKVRYRYDALGRRVERNLGSGKDKTKFTYDSHDVVLDDSNGWVTKYQNGPGIDNKLRTQNSNGVNYFLTDHLGTTNGLINLTGSVTTQTTFDSYGNPSSQLSTRYGFTGRERDDFTGLLYYRARYYDSNLGRFVSEDPLGLPGGLNLFSYVRNGPVNATDSLGLIPDGPGNFLRDPFAPERWIANGLSNTLSDLLALDNVARWAMRIGDYRCSTLDRLLAVAKLGIHTALVAASGAVAARATSSVAGISRGESLAHLTNAEAANAIDSSGVLAGSSGAPGGIYATPLSNAGSGVRATVTTGIRSADYQAAVRIPSGAEGAFSPVAPIGPFSVWQYLSGTQYTARGTLNLTSGTFSRTGVNLNQVAGYAFDSLATPGIIALTRPSDKGCGCK